MTFAKHDLKLSDGGHYSLSVTALNGARLSSQHQSVGVTVDSTPPVVNYVSGKHFYS